jgi:alpha-L-rhamnosidase
MAWLYREAAGIDAAADGSGFKKIVIRPRLDGRLNHARGEYDSVYGKVVTDWTGIPQGPFSLKVTVPANTTAAVYLPAVSGATLTEGGKPVRAEQQGSEYVVGIGSGSDHFEVK